MTYHYRLSEPGLFTVGFEDADGRWHPDSDHESRDGAAARCILLNGGGLPSASERRQIAAMALQGLLSGYINAHANETNQRTGEPASTVAEDTARDAVEYADALIARLNASSS